MGNRGFFERLDKKILDEIYQRRHQSVREIYDWLRQQPEFHAAGGTSKKNLDYYVGKLRKQERTERAKCVIASVVPDEDEVSVDDFDTLKSLDKLLENTLQAALEHSEAVLQCDDKTLVLKESHLKAVETAIAARERYVMGQRQILKDRHEERVTLRSFANTAVWRKIRDLPPPTVTGILDATRKASTVPQLKEFLDRTFAVQVSLSEVKEWVESFTQETREAAVLNQAFQKYRGISVDGVLKYCAGLLSETARKLEGENTIESAKVLTGVVKEVRQLAAGYVEEMSERERAESEALGALKIFQALQPLLGDFGASGAQFEALLKSAVEDLGTVKGLPPRET